MCDPSMLILGAKVVGIGAEAYGKFEETEAENKALEYNATVAEANAVTLEEQKERVQLVGTAKQGRIFSQGRRLAGTQQAALGASGVRVGVGSAADIIARTEDVAEADALTVRYNTLQEVRNLDTRKKNQLKQAGFLREQKRDALAVAGQTLLTSSVKALKLG